MVQELVEEVNKCCYYTLYSLSVVSLAKSLQLILKISATTTTDWSVICSLRAQYIISKNNVKLCVIGDVLYSCYFLRNNV